MERLKALLKGGQAGTTMGFSDELAGAIPAVMDKLGIAGGITEQNKKLAEQGFTGDVGPTNPEDLYTQERDVERAELAKAQDEHPLAFNAGNMAGMGLTSAIPASLLAKSMASGAGSADTMADVPEALAKSIAFSKLAGAISPATANMAGKKAPNFGKVLNEKAKEVPNVSHNEIMDMMKKSNLTDRLTELKDKVPPATFDKLKQMMINASRNKLLKDKM